MTPGKEMTVVEPVMKTAKGDGVTLQFAEWKGKGKTLLCIHGLTANCRCWDGIAEAIAPRHRILALDLRGRGFSDKPSSGYCIDHHCRDLVCLMDDLGLEKVVAVGHSLGAAIALALAAKHPARVDRMVLVDGGGKLSKEQMGKVFAGIKPSLDRLGRVFPSFDAYTKLLQKAPFLQPWSPLLETYFRYEVQEVDGGIRSRVRPEHIEEEIANLKDVDVARFYPETTCPVLILRATEGMLGEDDILLPEAAVQRMIRKMPDAHCVEVPGTNHYSILFQPQEARDGAVLDFLDAPDAGKERMERR
jgi:pimeloyl-ACP methyl ester carboxylesterase